MGEVTGIAWTDHTFNPWIGCTKVSAGCTYCYAEARDRRWGENRWGVGAKRERTSEANWQKVLAWDKKARMDGVRRRIFCASLADIMDAEVDPRWRYDLWCLVAKTTNLDWQILTKRPENLRPGAPDYFLPATWGNGWPNVWLGTSVEDQERLVLRAPLLTAVPAVVHFLSCEPLLSGLDLRRCFHGPGLPGVSWVILGGESGPKARPLEASWARSVVRQCRGAEVACFMKQMGAYVIDRNDAGFYGDGPHAWPGGRIEHLRHGYQGDPVRVHLFDPKGGDPAEWPQELRVREFPTR